MSRLVLITEGSVHAVQYFHNNGVFPSVILLDTLKFTRALPYMSKDDDILLVIQGLTDFTLAEVYALFKEFENNKETVRNITIMSNVHLGVIPYTYYLYEGDLFYGKVKRIERGKTYEMEEEQLDIEDVEKGKGKKKKSKENVVVPVEAMKNNAVMGAFKKYNSKKVKFLIYDKDDPFYKGKLIKYDMEHDLYNKLVDIELYEEES